MNKDKGFTLIELLFSFALLGILLLMSFYSSTNVALKNDQKLLIDDIRTAIDYAKIQAIILHSRISLKAINGSSNWSDGMALYWVNQKKHKIEQLYQWEWHHPQWLVTWSGAKEQNSLVFSDKPLNAMSNGTFDLYNIQSKRHMKIIVNRLGRVKISA